MAATHGTPDRRTTFRADEERRIRRPMTGITRRRWRRMRGGVAFLILSLSTVGWTIVLSAPPARADCTLLDPICVVEEATEPVTDVVEPVLEDVIEEVVEPTIEVVIDVVVEVVDEVSEGAEDPTAPVAPAAAPMEEPAATVEAPGVGTQPPDTPSTPTDPTDPRVPGEPGSGPEVLDGSTLVDAGVVVVGEAGATPGVPPADAPSTRAIASTGTLGIDRGLLDRFGGTLFDTGTAAVAFPLLLALIVAAFLLVQDRLDRRDPRLEFAPVRPGTLRFD